jgi:translation initiation factor IF-2
MAETTTPRLMAAAKEFNIGKDTLVDFLEGKGFSKDDLKPTSKLTEEMYRALQAGFAGDKVAKAKSDQIDLPKGAQQEARRKRDEEDLSFRKEEKKVTKREEPAPVAAEAEVPQPVAPQPEPQPAPEPVVEPLLVPVIEPESIPEPVQAEISQPEIVKLEAPEIEAPKVLDKIDLSAIDSSTRPKRVAKREEPAQPEVVAVETAPEPQPVLAETIAPEPEVAAPLELEPEVMAEVSAEEPALVIENIRAEKLEGPKILGKIQLPVDSDTRPKIDEKRKRKRIPIEKPGVPQAFQRGPGAGQQRPGQQATPGQGGGGRFQPRPAGQPGTQTGQGGGGRFQVGQEHRVVPGATALGGGNRTGGGRTDDKQIDEKEIQRKIQETQAKLSGGSGRGGRNLKKLRRDKRNEMAEAADGMEDNKLQVTEFISVSELANLMDVSFAEVIGKCMGLGIMVSINQRWMRK